MSAIAPARAPARTPARTAGRAPARAQTRPALQLVAAPRTGAGQLPFALVIAGVLGAGLVVLLMLHTLAAQDAFTVHKLQRQTAELDDVQQQLAVADQQAQAPSALAARARALGMVPTGSMRIVHRRDGRIVAIASAVPVPVPAPTPTASAAPSASASPSAAPTTTPSAGSGAGTTGASKPASKAPAKPRRPH